MRPFLGWLKYCLLELKWKPHRLQQSYDCVLITIYTNHKAGPKETFFGDLPNDLQQAGYHCLIAGKIAWHFGRDLENKLPEHHISFSHIISKCDGLKILFAQLLKGKIDTHNLTKAFFATMIQTIIKTNPNIKLLYPFEGNYWEEACIENHMYAIGYQHNALTPINDKRSKIQKLPKHVISTGPEATKIMTENLGLAQSKIIDGYALRVTVNPQKKRIKKSIKNILFLMQGHALEVEIIKLLQLFKINNSEFNITIRPHPAHPLDIKNHGFKISKNTDLHDDIRNHDCCVYLASTAAFESIAMGVPVIHMTIDKSIGDPLFQCPALHKSARDEQELSHAINELNDEITDKDFAKAENYFKTYFRPYKKEHVQDFIKWLNLPSQ
jgi:hypothetical protein